MSSILEKEIQSLVNISIAREEVVSRFLERLREDNLTIDENPISHFCVYFLPFDAKAKRIFIGHHKKSGLWLAPGGHIDKGERLLQALNREIHEELGIENKAEQSIRPFLLTISPIINFVRPCKEHLDLWYRIPTDGSDFQGDFEEFHETRWASINEARERVENQPNLEALDKMEQFFQS